MICPHDDNFIILLLDVLGYYSPLLAPQGFILWLVAVHIVNFGGHGGDVGYCAGICRSVTLITGIVQTMLPNPYLIG